MKRLLWIALVAVLIAASCSSDDGESTAEGGAADTGSGTLTMGVFAETNGLDPTVSFATGVIGGSELAAIYDTIMRYDPDTAQYETVTAESLTSSDDLSVWTLKLRPGITFTDGTAYDAEAVKFNVERHGADGSRSNYSSHVRSTIESIDVVDELTVRFNLFEPLASFPYILTVGPGMIGSPTAIKADPEGFNLDPVGAGPFMLETFRPGEPLVLTRNPDYWGEAPHLDTLRFVVFGSGPLTYEQLGREADVIFMRDPAQTAIAKEEHPDTIADFPQSAPLVMLINNGAKVTCTDGEPASVCAGQADGTSVATERPGSDIRVRRAIAAAIDSNVINERAYDGAAIATKDLYVDDFRWNLDVDGPAYDPELAKSLVEEAKADGWDGSIEITMPSHEADVALAVQTQLQAVGIDATTDTGLDTTEASKKVIIQRNYEIGNGGYNFGSSDTAYFRLVRQLHSESSGNIIGYESADMDAALAEVREAQTDDEKREAYGKVAEVFTRDVPSLPIIAFSETIVWTDDVTGLRHNSDTIVLFHDARVAA